MVQQQLTKGASKQGGPSPQKPQNKTAFCLRLNALRAMACISVIVTHMGNWNHLEEKLRSLHFGGHMAVSFFFSLSGYLLAISLVKEVKRRVYAENRSSASSKAAGIEEGRLLNDRNQSQSAEIEVPAVEIKEEPKTPSLMERLKEVKSSLLFSILGKYLWNRTWRLFPLYYGCWCVLKYFATDTARFEYSLRPGIPWSGILLLQEFPAQLWTMRIEIIFYYTAIPLYICALYFAFKWQKDGLKKKSTAAFAGIAGALFIMALYAILAGGPVLKPGKFHAHFIFNLPPFCFGMLAGLVNFVLEVEFNKRKAAAKAKEQPSDIEHEESTTPSRSTAKRISELVLSVLNKYKYSIIFTICFLRIVLLNPAILTFWTGKNEYPSWVMANTTCYWYAIFILINDSRGGFWKFMHPNGESQQTEFHPAVLHKTIYYFGLWSYPIYLIHPVSYVTLSIHFPLTRSTLEFSLIAIFICLVIGGLCDLVFDKILVNKIVFGKIIPGIGKVRKMLASKKTTQASNSIEMVKA